jgi:hypothetical protein
MPALSQAFSTSGQNQDHLTERAVVRPAEPAHRRAAVARRTWARQRVALSTSLPIVPVAGRGTVPLNAPWPERPAARLPFTCASPPVSHQPVRYHHPVPKPPGQPARWHIEPAMAGSPGHRAGWI